MRSWYYNPRGVTLIVSSARNENCSLWQLTRAYKGVRRAAATLAGPWELTRKKANQFTRASEEDTRFQPAPLGFFAHNDNNVPLSPFRLEASGFHIRRDCKFYAASPLFQLFTIQNSPLSSECFFVRLLSLPIRPLHRPDWITHDAAGGCSRSAHAVRCHYGVEYHPFVPR